MRLAIALLVSAVIAAPAFAQQQPKNTTAPKPAGQQQKAQEKSQENNAPNPEQQKLSEQEVLRQRLLLREKFNKGWDVTAENAKDRRWIASRCKNEARRQYSAIRPIKRRTYIKECMARAGR